MAAEVLDERLSASLGTATYVISDLVDNPLTVWGYGLPHDAVLGVTRLEALDEGNTAILRVSQLWGRDPDTQEVYGMYTAMINNSDCYMAWRADATTMDDVAFRSVKKQGRLPADVQYAARLAGALSCAIPINFEFLPDPTRPQMGFWSRLVSRYLDASNYFNRLPPL